MKCTHSTPARDPFLSSILFLFFLILKPSLTQMTYCAYMQPEQDYACSNYENDGGIDPSRCFWGTCQQCNDGGICQNTGYAPTCSNNYGQGCHQLESRGGFFELWSNNYGEYEYQYWRCEASCAEYRTCEPCDYGKSFRVGCGGDSAGECMECRKCGPGMYRSYGCYTEWNGFGSDAYCDYCRPGSYSMDEDNEWCSDCMLGSYSRGGATTCTQCSPGFYQAMYAMDTCLQCDAGTYQPNYGATDCIACAECASGYYKAGECGGASSGGCEQCRQCGPGTSLTGGCSPVDAIDAICSPCSAGEYSNEAHNFACSPCDTGTYQPATGASHCLACAACPTGHYRFGCSGGDAGQCVPCTNTN